MCKERYAVNEKKNVFISYFRSSFTEKIPCPQVFDVAKLAAAYFAKLVAVYDQKFQDARRSSII